MIARSSYPKRNSMHPSSEPAGLRVALVSMPWASLDMPSLALSVLQPKVAAHPDVATCTVTYANIQWADFVYSRTTGAVDHLHYEEIVRGYYVGTGEWVFSSALYDDSGRPEASPFHQLATRLGANLSAADLMHELAPVFIKELAASILATRSHIVGISTSFDQNIPSLALARHIKIAACGNAPEIVLGGANCDGVPGAALHRNYPFVDYVIRGEGEIAFPKLISAISRKVSGDQDPDPDRAFTEIFGLCWRGNSSESVANPISSSFVPIDEVSPPNPADYFEEFRRSRVCTAITPKLVVEGSRGCWWGQKHHCTFCGLNGTLMAFRKKGSNRMLEEITAAMSEHKCLDIVFADNIMGMEYLKEFLPALSERDWDLRLFFEVKSNLTYSQVAQLAAAGVTQIQPGIESFSGQVLDIMKKGVQGWQNVRLLRDCRTLTIYPGYNLLYGFPGETADEYHPVIEQIPNLTHLTPPEAAYRLLLTRFSPYFNDPSLGLQNLGPAGFLSLVYRLPKSELADLVYLFESEPVGLTGETERLLGEQCALWRERHRRSRLVAFEEEDRVKVIDERHGNSIERVLRPGLESDLYRALLRGGSPQGLANRLSRKGHDTTIKSIQSIVETWLDDGLVYRDGTHFVALATGLSY